MLVSGRVERLNAQYGTRVHQGEHELRKMVCCASLAFISALTGTNQSPQVVAHALESVRKNSKFDSQVKKAVASPANTSIATEPDLKIAFIGDVGHGPNQQAVLQLIKSEGAQAVLHQGDFDYT